MVFLQTTNNFFNIFLIYFFIFAYQKKVIFFNLLTVFYFLCTDNVYDFKPPAYDGLRHFLFVIPFFLALSSDLFDKYLTKLFVGILLLVGGVFIFNIYSIWFRTI